MEFAARAASIGALAALAEPVRRALYDYVVSQAEPVGREAAAVAVGVPVHVAKFHLDRLVADSLLRAEYRRLSGRSGPGAGRPAKVYARSDRQIAVSLPERRYDLIGHILAIAVEAGLEAQPGSGGLAGVLGESAYGEGRAVGEAAQQKAGRDGDVLEGDGLDRLSAALSTQGYEPRQADDVLVLANCPFDSLAREHTELVCAINRSYVQGVADGLGCVRARACLEPVEGRCCVTVRPGP